MKKLVVASFIALIIPFTSHAAINPGVEFLTPLVQTIIGLLQDRISVLVGENNTLRAQVASCQTIGSQTPIAQEPVIQPSQPVVTPQAQPVIIPQTVSVSYVYRTDAPYVGEGNTQDRCPTFTFASDKPFFVQKLSFNAVDGTRWDTSLNGQNMKYEGNVASVVLNGKGANLQSFRACFGDIHVVNLPTFPVTLLGAESLIYGADGKRIQTGDVSFTY